MRTPKNRKISKIFIIKRKKNHKVNKSFIIYYSQKICVFCFLFSCLIKVKNLLKKKIIFLTLKKYRNKNFNMVKRAKLIFIVLATFSGLYFYFKKLNCPQSAVTSINKLDYIRNRDFIRLDCQNMKRIGNKKQQNET